MKWFGFVLLYQKLTRFTIASRWYLVLEIICYGAAPLTSALCLLSPEGGMELQIQMFSSLQLK